MQLIWKRVITLLVIAVATQITIVSVACVGTSRSIISKGTIAYPSKGTVQSNGTVVHSSVMIPCQGTIVYKEAGPELESAVDSKGKGE